MATIVTPTTMTNAVRSIKGSSSTPSQAFQDLQAELGIGSTTGGGGVSDVFFAQMTSMRTIDSSFVSTSGGSPRSTPLRWDNPTTSSTSGLGAFTDSTNTIFRFAKTVIATVGTGIGAYVSMNSPYGYGITKGNAIARLYLGNIPQFGGGSKWTPEYQMFITELSACITKKFTSGEEVSVRLEAYAEGNSVNSSLSAYGSSPSGGASYFYVAA